MRSAANSRFSPAGGMRAIKMTTNAVSLVIGALCLCAFGAPFEPAAAECRIVKIAELPVRASPAGYLVDGEINGQPVSMIVDTGASRSILSRDAAARLGLKLGNVPGMHAYGIGGETRLQLAQIKKLRLGSLASDNIGMLVGLEHAFRDPTIAGILGDEIWTQADVEFDFADGAIRFFKPTGCKGGQIAYWASSFSEAALQPSDPLVPDVEAAARLNGVPFLAKLDSGAEASVVNLSAAQRAGVTPSSPGASPVGEVTGIGLSKVHAWIGTFDTFSLGDETIHHARIQMSNLFAYSKVEQIGSRLGESTGLETGMLLGADFFHAHRILVSQSQRMIYFTYNGGGVFQVAPARPRSDTAAAQAPPSH